MKLFTSIDSDDANQHIITKSGFQFLLMETSSQVWYFMLQYLDTVAMRNMSLVECLNFLFQLSFSTLGKDYGTDGLNNHMLKFLQHLREFGLVYQRKRQSTFSLVEKIFLVGRVSLKQSLFIHSLKK